MMLMFPGRPDSPRFGLLPAYPNRLPWDGPGRLGKREKSSLAGPCPPPGGTSLCSEAQLQTPRSMCCQIAPTISRLHATRRVQRATCPGCCLIANEEGTQVWFCSLRSLTAARLGGPETGVSQSSGAAVSRISLSRTGNELEAARAQALIVSKARPGQQSECKMNIL